MVFIYIFLSSVIVHLSCSASDRKYLNQDSPYIFLIPLRSQKWSFRFVRCSDFSDSIFIMIQMYSTDWNDKKKKDDFYPYRSDLPIILYAAVEIKYYFCTGMAKCYRFQKAVNVTKTPQWSNTNHTQLSTLFDTDYPILHQQSHSYYWKWFPLQLRPGYSHKEVCHL